MFDKLNINVNQECSHQVSGGGGGSWYGPLLTFRSFQAAMMLGWGWPSLNTLQPNVVTEQQEIWLFVFEMEMLLHIPHISNLWNRIMTIYF